MEGQGGHTPTVPLPGDPAAVEARATCTGNANRAVADYQHLQSYKTGYN